MFFYSRLQASFRSYLSLVAILSAGLTAAQPGLAQEQAMGDGIEDWVAATMCAVDHRSVDLEQTLSFAFTETDGNNPRHLNAAQAGLNTPICQSWNWPGRSLFPKHPVCVPRR